MRAKEVRKLKDEAKVLLAVQGPSQAQPCLSLDTGLQEDTGPYPGLGQILVEWGQVTLGASATQSRRVAPGPQDILVRLCKAEEHWGGAARPPRPRRTRTSQPLHLSRV
jgi:hypothetical protein